MDALELSGRVDRKPLARQLDSVDAMVTDRTMTTLLGLPRPFVLIEDRLDSAAPASLYSTPIEVVCCRSPEEVGEALDRIETAVSGGLHAAGFFSFELGYVFEPRLAPLLPRSRTMPLLWFGLFEEPTRVAPETLDAAFAALGPPPPIRSFHPTIDKHSHNAKAAQLFDYLAAGDVYQVNLTFPARFQYDGQPLALYAALRAGQPVAHGGVVAFDGTTILSVSPELFLDVQDGRVTTRPMKGTTGRSSDPDADRAMAERLLASPKQRAENLMIVDLLRNDLARLSEVGSVKVPGLFQVETYPTLHTLTSTVTARLRPQVKLHDILAATFPCGSVVGAPKHRAMEIIREVEQGPRGVYTGSIGSIAPNGDFKFNVAIRTATLTADGVGEYGVGGGIVADSQPEDEYEECLLKARVLTDLDADYGLIETFRWSVADGFARLRLHLDRLSASATQLGFVFARDAVEAELAKVAQEFLGAAKDRRVRVLLNRSGRIEITSGELGAEPRSPLRVGIAPERVDAGDPFLRHKTTRRQRYETAFARASASGLDEVVFLNRAGCITEASRNNVFVELEGRLATPPLAAGLLPGVLRRVLLDSGEAVEMDLTEADLRQAHRWFLGNSLRGLREARLFSR